LIAASPADAQTTPTAGQPIDDPSGLHAVIKCDEHGIPNIIGDDTASGHQAAGEAG
jgi:hypothetical protein